MSKKRIVLLVSAALVVGVLAVGGGAAYVYAKGSAALGEGPPLPFLGGGFFGGRGGHHGMAGFAGEDGNPMEMFNAAAEALGMTPEELFAELQAGKTPQEILDENDVDLATLAEKMGLTLPEGAEGFHGEGWMGRMGGFAGEDGHPMDMFNAAAEVLGMTPEELFAELQAGKTPQEILDENDVDLATLRESLQELMPEGVGHFRGGGRRMGRMGGFGKLGGGPMGGTDAVAEALGMTPEELSAELQAGKTLEEIIEAQGHDPEEFLSDVAEESIAQAVEDGRMTQEQADWLLQGLEQGYFPGPMGHGEGGPCGGGGGRGPWGGEKTPPSSE